ncbi:MAG TPA: protein kinase [Gemmatimonadales bacterium]|nr:protein kinase [Gemmatimonadales bacterium]
MPDITGRLSTAIADRYRIERHLGEGGMATVYLATDLKHDRQVALKVLRPELAAVIGAERFLAEIKTTAGLQHPHILPLHDSGEADGLVFYVMPFVEGESLRDRLTHERQLPVEDAIRIACEVADALDYAHRHGVIHRDIKPENILLHDGRALVADFGIALAVSRSEGGSRLTETGMSLGTPHYMSPEQAMGEREITARTDIYALGCVLYEMLTGEPPFVGPTAQAIVARVLTEEPRSLTVQRRTIPLHVELAVQKALAKLPADRFQRATEFAQALVEPGTMGGTYRTSTVQGAPALPAAPTRRPVLWALAAVAVLGTAFGIWGWLRARAAADQPASWQYVTLGDSLKLVLDGPSLALSPDGNTLVAKDDRQNGLLWLKRRDALDLVPLPGTERAQNPTFSPDGQWIAFVADGKLEKVRTGGGPTMTLADTVAGGFGGAAWLDDGTIVYAIPQQNTLRRISASGGASTAILHDSTLIGGGIGHPTALPGARGVLFQYCGSGCVTTSIHVLDLETGQQKLLLNDVLQAWYLPQGYLLYARVDGTVLAAPFDLKRLEITGEALPVLQHVTAYRTGAIVPLVWSRSGSLAYVEATGNSADLTVERVAWDGAATPVDTAWHGPFNSLDLSPDGRRLAVGVGAGANLNIWIKQLDRGPFTRLTFGNRDRRPAWSPDGKEVAFVRDSTGSGARGGGLNAAYVRPADGNGSTRLLARLHRQVQEVAWSPDGQWLVLRTDNATAGAGDLMGVHVHGDTTPVSLVASPFSEIQPAVSPNGRWLAYTSDESGTNEVYVRPFPNTDDGRWQVSIGGGQAPAWSRAGTTLFYVAPDGHLMAAAVHTTPPFSVESRTPLFDASGYSLSGFHQDYVVLPGGRSFLFLHSQATAGEEQPRLVWVDHWFSDLAAKLEQ